MQDLFDRTGNVVAWVAIFSLFPGTFVYHSLAALEVIPMFLGGWWGAITVLFGGLLGALLIASSLNSRDYRRHLLFAAMCVIVLSYAVYHRVWGAPWQRTDEAAFAAFSLLAGWACFYGIGWFATIRAGIWFSGALLVCWGGMILGVLCLLDPVSRSFDIQARFQNAELADYKFLAGCFALTSLLSIGAVSTAKVRGIIFAASTAVLFLMTARAELVAVLGVGLVWGVLRAREGDWFPPLLASAVLGSLMLLIALPLPLPSPTSNMAEGQSQSQSLTRAPVAYAELLNIGESQSGKARSEMLARGLHDIASSPFFGVYAGQTADGSGWGTYVHNLLEAWRQFGMLGFLNYAILVFGALYSAFLLRVRRGQNYDMVFAVALYAAGLCVVANGVFWLAPALAWGLVNRACLEPHRFERDRVAAQGNLERQSLVRWDSEPSKES